MSATASAPATEPAPADEVNEEATELPTNQNSPSLLRARHSAAHVLAMAVQSLWPGAAVATGPWTETG
jgi:threonyl-tRNA synthetase